MARPKKTKDTQPLATVATNNGYENTFDSIDDILRDECSTELDYIEQISWLLFLRYIDERENELEQAAELDNKTYKRVITGYYRWSSWAAPKKPDGSFDNINAMTGDSLAEFVQLKLFPYLKDFKNTAADNNSLEYKIGEIFSEITNKIKSGYNLREVINKIDTLHFQSADDKHEMTVLYEGRLNRMGNAGRNGGEYYTPRPLIRAIVKVLDPKIGETVCDPNCGSAGFLCEAFLHMKEQVKSTRDERILQEATFKGGEKKVLAYIIAIMNMIFHGINAPNLTRGNTLAKSMADIMPEDQCNVIATNPPFGSKERPEIQQNFDIRTSETAYMFMQHYIGILKPKGRAGVVIKNTFLSNGDASPLRRYLLTECNLHTILELPSGVFSGAGVKTVVIFFDKGTPTKKIWYYQVNPGRTLGKTAPLNDQDLEEFVTLQKTKADSPNSWTVDISHLDLTDSNEPCDLSVKNPHKVEVVDNRTPQEIASQIVSLNQENDLLLQEIMNALKNGGEF